MDRDFILQRAIPYSLTAVSTLAIAFAYAAYWDAPRRMEIYFDGRLSVEGTSNTFVSLSVESGLMHCRALLEFLGLCLRGENLANVQSRRLDDVGIELFSNSMGPLKMVTPLEAISHYGGQAAEVERALVTVFHVTNKGFAHFTTGLNASLATGDALEIAARGVPSLVVNHLYVPLGLLAPDFEVKGRVRSGR